MPDDGAPLPVPPAAAPLIEGGILTQEQANKLLRRDISNLVKKVATGRTLSASERAIVQSAAEGTEASKAKAWAKDQVDLANVLGVDRRTIRNWRKEGAPDAESDGRWNVTAWKEWMKAHGKQSGRVDDSPTKAQQEARRLLLQNEKLETEIGILRGEYTKNAEIEAHIRSMVAEARKLGEQMPASLAPQLAGCTVPEIEKRLRAWWDDFCLRLHTGTPGARGKQ